MLFEKNTLLTILVILLCLHIIAAILFSSIIQRAKKITIEQRRTLRMMNFVSPIMAFFLLRIYQRQSKDEQEL
jgi:hypothetical protein